MRREAGYNSFGNSDMNLILHDNVILSLLPAVAYFPGLSSIYVFYYDSVVMNLTKETLVGTRTV